MVSAVTPVPQSIYFDEVEDLARCVEAAVADPELNIVRVKNRLEPAFDALRCGGFRLAPAHPFPASRPGRPPSG